MTPLKIFVQTSEAQLWARNYEWLPYTGTCFMHLMRVFIGARNYEWLPYLCVSYMVADDEKCAKR